MVFARTIQFNINFLLVFFFLCFYRCRSRKSSKCRNHSNWKLKRPETKQAEW